MDEMTEVGTILFYILFYFYVPCHSVWQKYVSIGVDINLSTRAVLKISVQ